MVVLPYYLHDYKAFAKMTILGEFLAIATGSAPATFWSECLPRPVCDLRS